MSGFGNQKSKEVAETYIYIVKQKKKNLLVMNFQQSGVERETTPDLENQTA